MSKDRPASNQTMIYDPTFVSLDEKQQIYDYLSQLHPIWETRYSESNPPPEGEKNRSLLRPVYWLGNWQFACLDYYHPPRGLYNRCVRAEPFPAVLEKLKQKVELMVKDHYLPKDIPSRWELNTCLINFYGSKLEDEGGQKKWQDVARVGEHKDFEPGPVASLSFGERAYFQFVTASSQVVISQWLEDRSLQIFAGDRLKKQLFHRVQRVEDKGKLLPFEIENFKTRRVNFTFRYVPRDHFVDFSRLPGEKQRDVMPYVKELAEYSDFFKSLLEKQTQN